jgi:hypothetical protein
MQPTDYIGRKLPDRVVVIERGPVSNFARAVKDDSDVYQRPDAAEKAGLPAIPAPPTFSAVMGFWGAFPELQPEPDPDAVDVTDLMAALRATGGMILHASQSFEYHVPIVVGDVLYVGGVVEDVYPKTGSNGKVMTFVRLRTEARNDAGSLVVTERMTLLHKP